MYSYTEGIVLCIRFIIIPILRLVKIQ